MKTYTRGLIISGVTRCFVSNIDPRIYLIENSELYYCKSDNASSPIMSNRPTLEYLVNKGIFIIDAIIVKSQLTEDNFVIVKRINTGRFSKYTIVGIILELLPTKDDEKLLPIYCPASMLTFISDE